MKLRDLVNTAHESPDVKVRDLIDSLGWEGLAEHSLTHDPVPEFDTRRFEIDASTPSIEQWEGMNATP